jgi:gliding motility-associated lipoprotein GldJ
MKGKFLKSVGKISLLGGMVILSSCGKEVSNVTGWEYNEPKNGGFEVQYFEEQETGPGLLFIEGGKFTMGRVEQDVMADWTNVPRTQSVSSFYMDETEVSNKHWREYVYWLERVFGMDYPEVVAKALPDTLVWRSELAYMDPYVELYYRHPAYADYPVVGVNWLQTQDFCVWRTDRVNEMILIREGVLKINPQQVAEDNYNYDAYLLGQYEGLVKADLEDLNPNAETRKVRIEDGIFLPRYRLPTESEWEFAALGLIGNTFDERINDRRLYPWNGHWVRNKDEEFRGQMMANYTRAKGDRMGVAGALNDHADVTTDIYDYWPNDYGLYHMAGNVSEWVMDVYRPLTLEDGDEFRSFRGNVFQTWLRDDEGYIAEKDSLGRMIQRNVDNEHPEDDLANRRNYERSDNINIYDGDFKSSVYYYDESRQETNYSMKNMYEHSKTTLISNRTRVYKGGNWEDRTYWLVPGTRRFLDERQATRTIGFRCAMHRVGKQSQF